MTMTATLPLPNTAARLSDRQRAAHREARRQVFLRRRLLVVVLAVIVVVGLVASTRRVQADDGSAPITGEPMAYVVQPGDSLWSIAKRLAPGSDPRPIVHRLERSAGSALLSVGQTVIIPAELVD